MKPSGLLFGVLFMFSCIDKEKFEDRKVIGQINDKVAFLDIELVEQFRPGFVFELQSPVNFQFLSVIGNGPPCTDLTPYSCISWQQNYLNNYFSIKDPSSWQSANRRLWYKISGYVKQRSSNDKFVGNPFFLTKSERIFSCPVNYKLTAESVQLVETEWRLVGFIDENDKIYSHPACESNNVILEFTPESLDNLPFNLPNGKVIHLDTGDYLFYQMQGQILSYSILEESGQIRIRYLNNPFHIGGMRNFVMYDGGRTIETQNKSDSLLRLIGGSDTIDYALEKNILKLSNPKTKLKAMFVTN